MGTGEGTGGAGGDIWLRVGRGHADDGGNILISGTNIFSFLLKK